MNEEWKQTLQSLERVWPRVSGGPPPPPGRPHAPPPPPGPPPPGPGPEMQTAQLLAPLIRMEAEALTQFQGAASAARGRPVQALRKMAAESRELLRHLQSEYYLNTGDTLALPRERFRSRGLQEDLRQAWQEAGRAERAYRDTAQRTRDRSLRRLCLDGAALKERQQNQLRLLFRGMFA